MRELTRREMQVLAFVDRHEGERFTAERVAAVLDLLACNVTAMVKRLCAWGYLDRSPDDRAASLTKAGRRMLWPHASIGAAQ